jgi:hypothetical protein
MLKPIQEKLLKSIDELFESNYKIEYFEDFNFTFYDNLKYRKALKENRVMSIDIFSDDDNEWVPEYIRRNFASLQSCKHFKNLIDHQGDGKSWRGLYQIQEVALIERQNLFTAPFHPLQEKFQDLMDFSFEAGLPMAWEKFHFEFLNFYNRTDKIVRKFDTKQILDFSSIAPIFLILIFGFQIALIALLFEVFFHDFLLKLPKDYFRKKIWSYAQEKFKVKTIQVRPVSGVSLNPKKIRL